MSKESNSKQTSATPVKSTARQHGEQATALDVKRAIRKKLRRQEEHEEEFLNIYPMMDMMTILLVFMVMLVAESAESKFKPSEQLDIPYSASELALIDSGAVTIEKNELMVGDKRIINLNEGLVANADKQGGDKGSLIPKLKRAFELQRKKQESLGAFKPEVLIVADKDTPYKTITEVVYTLGQVGYSDLRFVAREVP